ncbi:DUF397 domain-containing protein [Streptomyces chrestomyceticus]|uniref:DUF397 domain-containing protein n=1 Tax=Streptomyces chrestomyceticus TaxID=68185 RepID=UPI0037918945
MNGSSDGFSGAPRAVGWRKSSHSGGSGGNCLEVWDGAAGIVPVRDSKNPHGPALLFPEAAFAVFVDAVSRGEFGA